jgi:hypothetical protein
MRAQIFIIILLIASLCSACSHKTKTESGKVEVKEVTLYDYQVDDEVEPPPPDLISNFKNLHDWLVNICNDKKPNKLIANYEFGLFESPDDYTIFLVGINRDRKGDTSFTHIDFKPSNMYFQLPQGEYKNLTRDELLNRLISQLKEFTETEQFKSSFFVKADKITFTSNGQTIWSKP